MPRVPRFKTVAVGELFRQLRYAPAETMCREMDAAEELVGQIEGDRNYPEEFIVYRVTGYRPDSVGEPVMLVGEALVPDLVGLVQALSYTVDLPTDYQGREALTLAAVAERMNISTKTVQRYRHRGLVCHYVKGRDGVKRLSCFADALSRFETLNASQVGRAGAFTRTATELRDRIVEEASSLRRRESVSLNEAAKRLAAKYGRSHETIRTLLREHDQRSETPIFDERGPLTSRDRERLLRAQRAGVPAAELARRWSRTPAAILRATQRARADRLRGLDLSWVELPTFAIPESASVILAAPAVTQGLDEWPGDDIPTLLQVTRVAPPIDEQTEESLVAAYNLLKQRAATVIATLTQYPEPRALDAAETDLRWAARLKSRLVALSLPAAMRVIEQNLHRRLLDEPADEVHRLLDAAMRVATRTIDRLDPTRDHRLERRTAHEMDRALASRRGGRPSGRAAARHQPGTLRLAPTERRFCRWQKWLDPAPDLSGHLDCLDDQERDAFDLRYGWEGHPPLTIQQLGTRLRKSPRAAAALVRRAERKLVQAARRGRQE